jgi:hypothetical protein
MKKYDLFKYHISMYLPVILWKKYMFSQTNAHNYKIYLRMLIKYIN